MDPPGWGQRRRPESQEALVPDLQSLLSSEVADTGGEEGVGVQVSFQAGPFHMTVKPPHGQQEAFVTQPLQTSVTQVLQHFLEQCSSKVALQRAPAASPESLEMPTLGPTCRL